MWILYPWLWMRGYGDRTMSCESVWCDGRSRSVTASRDTALDLVPTYPPLPVWRCQPLSGSILCCSALTSSSAKPDSGNCTLSTRAVIAVCLWLSDLGSEYTMTCDLSLTAASVRGIRITGSVMCQDVATRNRELPIPASAIHPSGAGLMPGRLPQH